MKLPKDSVIFHTLLIAVIVCIAALVVLQYVSNRVSSKKETFDSPKASLVYYFVPWCKHCQQFMPIWDSLTKSYSDKKVEFKKVNMELESNKYLGPKYNIVSYPTVILHKGNLNDRFEGERNVDTLTAFLNKHLQN